MPFGKSSGIFGLGLANSGELLLVGGDYVEDNKSYTNFCISNGSLDKWSQYELAPIGLKEAVLSLNNNKFLLIGTSGTTLWDHESKLSAAIDQMSFHTGVCNDTHCFAIGGSGSLGVWRK